MRYARLALSLLVFVPSFTAFGLAGWGGDWYGGVVGAGLGLVFAAVFAGPWERRR